MSEEWEKRLEWMAGNDKCPNKIAEDIIRALQEIDRLRSLQQWRPIESAPKDKKCFFWVRPRTEEDEGVIGNTSGRPILTKSEPRRVEGMYGCCWTSLEKAVYWMPVPSDPL